MAVISRKRKNKADDDKNLNTTSNRKRSTKTSLSKKNNIPPSPWSNLHIDMVRLIMSQLSLADRIRSRAVCKTWLLPLNEIPPTRSNNEDQVPWIMSFQWKKTYAGYVVSTCRLHDPGYKKQAPYIMEEDITKDGTRDKFVDANICALKHGWVMFYHHVEESSTWSFFLFNPFTKDILTLPDLSLFQHDYAHYIFDLATFSSSPTSSDSVILVLESSCYNRMAVRTCRCSDSTWVTYEFEMDYYVYFTDAVYVDGTFYCVSNYGKLAAFNVAFQEWTLLTDVEPLPKSYTRAHLVESNREILLIYMEKEPLLYVFDKSKKVWVSKQDIGNRALFLGDSSYSVSAAAVGGEANNIANNVYFLNYLRNPCFYSFRDGKTRYCRGSEIYGWDLGHGLQRIWFQPPSE